MVTFPTGTYTAIGEDTKDILYGRNDIHAFMHVVDGGFVISKSNRSNQQDDVRVWWGKPSGNVASGENITFTRGTVVSKEEYFFEQELIYNGKSGNNIKFLYRELSSNMMRAPFTQDIQYDLNESKTIGFKGARIDIIKATNRQIEYIVRKPFR